MTPPQVPKFLKEAYRFVKEYEPVYIENEILTDRAKLDMENLCELGLIRTEIISNSKGSYSKCYVIDYKRE